MTLNIPLALKLVAPFAVPPAETVIPTVQLPLKGAGLHTALVTLTVPEQPEPGAAGKVHEEGMETDPGPKKLPVTFVSGIAVVELDASDIPPEQVVPGKLIVQLPPFSVNCVEVPAAPAYVRAVGVAIGRVQEGHVASAVTFVPNSWFVPKPPTEFETH